MSLLPSSPFNKPLNSIPENNLSSFVGYDFATASFASAGMPQNTGNPFISSGLQQAQNNDGFGGNSLGLDTAYLQKIDQISLLSQQKLDQVMQMELEIRVKIAENPTLAPAYENVLQTIKTQKDSLQGSMNLQSQAMDYMNSIFKSKADAQKSQNQLLKSMVESIQENANAIKAAKPAKKK